MAASIHRANSQEHPLWVPRDPGSAPTFRFMHKINIKYGLSLASYYDFYCWSVDNIADFWSAVWDETDVLGDKGVHVVDAAARPSDNPAWFADSRLNWAENMLRCRSADKVALVQATEPTPSIPTPDMRIYTYAQLYEKVANLVSAFLARGFVAGDRVASYSSNCNEVVAVFLATIAVGGIWTSASADFGPEGVFERRQIQPKFLFAVDSVVYNAKVHAHIPKVKRLTRRLADKGTAVPHVIVIHAIPHEHTSGSSDWETGWTGWADFLEEGKRSGLGVDASGEIKWSRLPFDYPSWILFSSGTTGRPKYPIVHRAGGQLLQSKKELMICGGLTKDDVYFYYTTTGWMMYQFLVGGLSLGCTLVLYDGSPLRDPSFLWKLVDDLGITVFGTSAKYIDHLSKTYKPREHHRLSTLKQIYSTGSPLAPHLFDYVYESISPDVLLGSITGGTDICSLFAGMCTGLPVYRGEIQCRMLGMAIQSYLPTGMPAAPGESGELVCLKPAPSMPVGFWPLPGFGDDMAVASAKDRYKQAYFAEFEGVWYHGDHVAITRSRSGNGGGVIMLGRSDGVLNPSGVRFGSAEIYDVIESCFGAHEIADCLAVGQAIDNGADERVILCVKLPEGANLTPELEYKIRTEIRTRRTPRHVPARVLQVPDIPYTLNGKRVEVLVKKIFNGTSLHSVNASTLVNPECLDFYMKTGELLRAS
ncbi:acetoacetate-CoA ligase [Fistulina hepatica ATCC 64428]|nr:acetoacetate-CoA ligase [Fistulina hepatica ATCC 64428]